MTLKRLSVQVMNVALEILSREGNKYDQKHLAANSFCIRIQNFNKDEKWLLQYNLLLFIERLWVVTPQFFKYRETKIEKTIFLIVQLLKHEHEWLQSSSTNIGSILKNAWR